MCIDLFITSCLHSTANMALFIKRASSLSCIFIFVLFQECFSKEQFFTEVAKELRCSGCDLTVKVLDRMLVNVKKENLEHQVDEVLDVVCDKDRFSISEYKPETMVKVCKFLKEYHHGELKRELMDHYSQPKKPTYLEFAQHICLDVMKMCAGVSHKWQDKEDTMVHIDADHGFTVVPGRNIKMPKPVTEHHDEL